MFNKFRWSKNKTKHKNSEEPQNKKTKKIVGLEKYRRFSKVEEEAPVAESPPLESTDESNDLDNGKHVNTYYSEHFQQQQNKRINSKLKNDGKFYFNDDNKTKITLNLTSQRAAQPAATTKTSAIVREPNAHQLRETANSATTASSSPFASKINEIFVANPDGSTHSHNESKNSRNELAERQGSSTLIGNNLLLFNNQENSDKPEDSPITSQTEEDLATTKASVITRKPAQFSNEAKIRNKTTATSAAAAATAHKKIESKRQSWFGLHLLRNKNNAQENQQQQQQQHEIENVQRKPFFLRKSKSIDNDKPTEVETDKSQTTAECPNQTDLVLQQPHTEKALNKSENLFNGISMARGRNQARLRNNQQHQQQQHQQYHHQQQQQQHHNNVKNNQDNSQNNDKNATKTLIHTDNAVTNKSESANNKTEDVTESLSLLHSTHLETIYDPANESRNSYQITTANNSNNRNVETAASAQFSNSAESELAHESALAREQQEENSPTSDICAEALSQCNKERHQQSCLLEQQDTFAPISDRHAFPTDSLLKNSANQISDQLQPLATNDADTGLTAVEAKNCDTATSDKSKETDAKSKLNELAECDRDRLLYTVGERVETSVMGQTSGKQEATKLTRPHTPREFRESVIGNKCNDIPKAERETKIIIPTITVEDYTSPVKTDNNNKFMQSPHNERKAFPESSFQSSAETTNHQFIDSFSRLNPVVLDDVPEQEESEEDEDDIDVEQVRNVHNGLSSSFPDSGIGLDSFASRFGSPLREKDNSLHSNEQMHTNSTGGLTQSRHSSTRASSLPISPSASSRRLPFIRDEYSTDCDDSLMQCDEFDCASEDTSSQIQIDLDNHERLVCIESISLPDVVVESTALSNGSHSAAFQTGSSDTEQININGTTGNTMERVHFIPIRVEKDNKFVQKGRSIDDIGIAENGRTAYVNRNDVKSTIEITSEEDENYQKGLQQNNAALEKLRCDLVNQESRYSAQLDEAQKKTLSLQSKINEMQTLIDTLEKDLAIKTWNVEKLQAELKAAHKDDEFVRKRLKLLEEEKTTLRHKYCDNEDVLNRKYDELEQKYKELEEKYKTIQALASNLHTQLAEAQSDADQCREEMNKIREEMEEQLRLLKSALENSEAERKIGENKWQKEFEMLRTHNQDREESLMTDCEWQLRQMQRQCKDKIDKAEFKRKEAVDKAEVLECAAQERLKEMQKLRLCEAEAKSLRGLTREQEQTVLTLTAQLESLRNDLEIANESLEDQIEAVKTIKYQCDNKIYDKERELIQRIDFVRNEAASFWEDKLYTEMTRLKSELESVFIDERRDALDKLQAEHIEELRALTTRYTANEEELRAELAELQERLDQKSEDFLELREKSDNALLQTRMHLDKADRDFQNAMSREEERREALEESLRKEFEAEKNEMEEKFRERIEQVKDEFSRELQISTQELQDHHKKELAQQKSRLQAEKDEAVQELVERHRKKLALAQDQLKNIELQQQRDLKDLKAAYDAEKASLDKRDISNANEIEQLHRKCRCLTNLFEEMRVRYERRDPRPEDLREISELRSRCESQERDLYLLTDRLREMQMQMVELQQNGADATTKKIANSKSIKKPPPKTIPTNCDVIYEENEERESPPPPPQTTVFQRKDSNTDEEEETESDDDNDDDEDVTVHKTIKLPPTPTKSKKSCSDLINEDDGHMITAV